MGLFHVGTSVGNFSHRVVKKVVQLELCCIHLPENVRGYWIKILMVGLFSERQELIRRWGFWQSAAHFGDRAARIMPSRHNGVNFG